MNKNYILKGIKIIDKALFIEENNTLIINDLQLGIEESILMKGLFIPRKNLELIINDLKKIFKQTGKLKTIIINGDLKHEFSKITKQEKNESFELIEFLLKNTEN